MYLTDFLTDKEIFRSSTYTLPNQTLELTQWVQHPKRRQWVQRWARLIRLNVPKTLSKQKKVCWDFVSFFTCYVFFAFFTFFLFAGLYPLILLPPLDTWSVSLSVYLDYLSILDACYPGCCQILDPVPFQQARPDKDASWLLTVPLCVLSLEIDMLDTWKDRWKDGQTEKTTPNHTKECLIWCITSPRLRSAENFDF